LRVGGFLPGYLYSEGVNGSVFPEVFSLIVGADCLAVLHGGGRQEIDRCESVVFRGEDGLYVPEIIGVVGGELNFAAGLKGSEDLAKIGLADEAAFVVSSFGPGVREVDVEAVDAVIGQVAGDERGGFCTYNSDVGQVPSADAVDGVAIVFSCPFDAEEVDVGLCFGLVDEKGGFAGADFDLEFSGTSENMEEIDFAVEVLAFNCNRRIVF